MSDTIGNIRFFLRVDDGQEFATSQRHYELVMGMAKKDKDNFKASNPLLPGGSFHGRYNEGAVWQNLSGRVEAAQPEPVSVG